MAGSNLAAMYLDRSVANPVAWRKFSRLSCGVVVAEIYK
jgi:hypothetical protein